MSINIRRENRGINYARCSQNPRERAMAVAWQEQQTNYRMLEYILSPHQCDKIEEVSDRDRLVANTIVQWLGTEVGQQFLKDAAKKVRSKKK